MHAANTTAEKFITGTFEVKDGGGLDVVTEADRCISDVLRHALLAPDEGWLSEEDPDDRARLSRKAVWVVDPLDGTREFVDGIPEWCISIGLVVEGIAVAGGISNPATGEVFLGSLNLGVTYNNEPVQAVPRKSLNGALILASRQEYNRGEWACFEGRQFSIRPTGSIAYKLALVSAGLADATWTLSPKNEWDIAAGVALVRSAGGRVACLWNADLEFNRSVTLVPGLAASSNGIWEDVVQLANGADPARWRTDAPVT